ncbi:MAG: type II toxin-antitoxin system VapC family toxin [Candidatus Bathyarchaeia archaeon]
MRIFIDSNLLIYLNTLVNRSLRIIYEDFYIRIIEENEPYTDILVLDELIYISQKRYNVPYKTTLEFIEEIVKPFVNIISLGEDEYNIAAKVILEHNIKPSDALHLGAMKKKNISTIVSEDKDFDKIEWINRFWLTT